MSQPQHAQSVETGSVRLFAYLLVVFGSIVLTGVGGASGVAVVVLTALLVGGRVFGLSNAPKINGLAILWMIY